MAGAYVRIWVTGGHEEAVVAALRAVSVSVTPELTAGDQDVVVRLEAETYDLILALVRERIRTIPGVTRTSTNLVLAPPRGSAAGIYPTPVVPLAVAPTETATFASSDPAPATQPAERAIAAANKLKVLRRPAA